MFWSTKNLKSRFDTEEAWINKTRNHNCDIALTSRAMPHVVYFARCAKCFSYFYVLNSALLQFWSHVRHILRRCGGVVDSSAISSTVWQNLSEYERSHQKKTENTNNKYLFFIFYYSWTVFRQSLRDFVSVTSELVSKHTYNMWYYDWYMSAGVFFFCRI